MQNPSRRALDMVARYHTPEKAIEQCRRLKVYATGRADFSLEGYWSCVLACLEAIAEGRNARKAVADHRESGPLSGRVSRRGG